MQTIKIEVKLENGISQDEAYEHVKTLLEKDDLLVYSISLHNKGEEPTVQWDCPEI